MSRGLGVALLALVMLPWYRLTARRAAGPSVDQTLRLGHDYLVAHWSGLAVGVLMTLALSRVAAPARFRAPLHAAGQWILHAPSRRFGAGLGLLSAAIASWVGTRVLHGRPALLDGVSQLIQARYLEAGRVSGPPLVHPEFWQFQFMIPTDVGWAAQYPPGFAAVLAAAMTVGVVWLAGPLLLGLAVYATAQVAERLYPDDRVIARTGAALMAVSPFLAFHAGAYMNHVLALALVSVAALASLRALDGPWPWALLSGAAVGWLFATRPLVGVVLGLVATVLVWWCAPGHGGLSRRDWAWRLGATMVGAAPFVAALMVYNARLFGGPTRFGYIAAAGPSHGLGFHVDPWGNPYGPSEALGHSSADLLGLSVELLQTPLPALLVVALYLVRGPVIDRSTVLLGLWALLPLASNALYWHHDLFMGPRLLYEAAPAWCLLVAVSAVGLIRDLPARSGARRARPIFARSGFAATLALALAVALGYAAPAKLRSYAVTAERSDMRLAPPAVDRPSLVFVHDSWESRLGARLSALGVRLDSARAALLLNTTCEVELFVRSREADGHGGVTAGVSSTDLRFEGGASRPLRDVVMPSGARIRTYQGETLPAECERQAAADYTGVVSLPPLLWQGDLPGLEAAGPMFVRDHGPERNMRLLDRYPGREPALLVRRGSDAPRLVPYERGMEELWAPR